ncbi:hydrolase [Rhizobium sp. Root1220]|uniref:hydrolase n=1 Tax=Rhizobium sp. Root1220 TaxID=1736432 RepID=UPI0006FC99EE|nr:hydrolase [Rhizobium sp. Root1220]KQV70335.1 hydrolase [Rhizobium sp. Root1220]
MVRRSLDHLHGPLAGIDLISTDVFDTLLLRQPKSQRSRLMEGERRFARLLREQGIAIGAEDLARARLLAERFAYRALNIGGIEGEVRLIDLVARQLAILGLPAKLIDTRVELEVETEKASLSANGPLAMALRLQRQAGVRIIAVSDTALPTDRLAHLIDYFHGPGLIDKVYSSAEMGTSKRHGGLFSAVLDAENVAASRMLHIGDDRVADCLAPRALGISSIHIPKGRIRKYAAQADGARTEALRGVRRGLRPRLNRTPAPKDQISFGREVFGPIVSQFCLHIWLFAQQAEAQGDAAMLFCARGGIGIREAFERLVAKLGLPLGLRRENVLISRLVAARSALMVRSPAVLDELQREFKKSSFAEVAAALGGRRYELPTSWQEAFAAPDFFDMLDTPHGREVLEDIERQNALFVRHLDSISGTAKRTILCDTGLYGSTQRLMAAAFPDRQFETIQFARCNYKGLSEEHFPKVAGLVVEQSHYSPLKAETVILRYWQIIESLFEPAIPSVRQFSETADGAVTGNCGDIAYRHFEVAAGNALLSGVLQYIERVDNGVAVMQDADLAWARLKQAITYPSSFDMMALGVGARSIDFGRTDSVDVMNEPEAPDVAQRLKSLKSHLWREGAIARDFPRLKSALLPALEVAHIVRGVSARLQR